jgi:hypothetical protein
MITRSEASPHMSFDKSKDFLRWPIEVICTNLQAIRSHAYTQQGNTKPLHTQMNDYLVMRFLTLTLFILSLSSAYAGERKFWYSSGGTNRRGGKSIPVTGGPKATSPEVTATIEPLKESNASDHESEGTQGGGLRGKPNPPCLPLSSTSLDTTRQRNSVFRKWKCGRRKSLVVLNGNNQRTAANRRQAMLTSH